MIQLLYAEQLRPVCLKWNVAKMELCGKLTLRSITEAASGKQPVERTSTVLDGALARDILDAVISPGLFPLIKGTGL